MFSPSTVLKSLSAVELRALRCTARGYLAYNLRGGITPGVTGHLLKVVRFDSKPGVYLAGQVMLQDFQVHRMICTQDRIDISGYANVFKQYAITIAGPAGSTNRGVQFLASCAN